MDLTPTDAPRIAHVWQAPCGCAVDVGLPDCAYRFCRTHSFAVDGDLKRIHAHIRSLWQDHAESLNDFFEEHRGYPR